MTVFPTGVGMFLFPLRPPKYYDGLPHGRGDVSNRFVGAVRHSKSSPRAWGCFYAVSLCTVVRIVFPTGVGMFLEQPTRCKQRSCLPHGRGDVSGTVGFGRSGRGSSPRAWGCFLAEGEKNAHMDVFPTGVGMFLKELDEAFVFACLPHGRGDVSTRQPDFSIRAMSSPRAWGCFLHMIKSNCRLSVFPTGVGMFLCSAVRADSFFSLPHGRGDVSSGIKRAVSKNASSPRAWGCFLLFALGV